MNDVARACNATSEIFQLRAEVLHDNMTVWKGYLYAFECFRSATWSALAFIANGFQVPHDDDA
jgi:hypothetical protein